METPMTITREQFIYDFMMKSPRPVTELEEFVRIFDKRPSVEPLPNVGDNTPKPKKKSAEPKRVITVASNLTRAKYIQIWKDEYPNDKRSFAGQYAVAEFLGVTQSSVSYALKNKGTVKGWHLKTITGPFGDRPAKEKERTKQEASSANN